jgi:hypothetical protein
LITPVVGPYTIRGLYAQKLFERMNPVGGARQMMTLFVSKTGRRA